MDEINTSNKNELSDMELRMYCVEQAVRARVSVTEKTEDSSLADEAAWLYLFLKGYRYFNTESLSIDPNKSDE